jgi:hypothetical protein
MCSAVPNGWTNPYTGGVLEKFLSARCQVLDHETDRSSDARASATFARAVFVDDQGQNVTDWVRDVTDLYRQSWVLAPWIVQWPW